MIVSPTAIDDKTFNSTKEQQFTLALRLICLVLLVVLLTCHIRAIRVFRWEQSVSGGLLVTYVVAVSGMALGAAQQRGEKAFQVAVLAFICASGSVLLAVNACVLYQRWSRAGELTRMVAELLGTLGVPIQRQVLTKVILSTAVAILLFIDLTMGVLLTSK